MSEFTLTIETVEGVGDSDFLDRLADVVYEEARLITPALTVDQETGAVTAIFNLEAESLQEAAELGAKLFGKAIVVAEGRSAGEERRPESRLARVSIEPAEPEAALA